MARLAKQLRPTALVVDVYSAGTLPSSPWQRRYHFGDWGEKYFPKQADSQQNKHLGLGVHAASKESQLSQGECPCGMEGKTEKGGDSSTQNNVKVKMRF